MNSTDGFQDEGPSAFSSRSSLLPIILICLCTAYCTVQLAYKRCIAKTPPSSGAHHFVVASLVSDPYSQPNSYTNDFLTPIPGLLEYWVPNTYIHDPDFQASISTTESCYANQHGLRRVHVINFINTPTFLLQRASRYRCFNMAWLLAQILSKKDFKKSC
jgi:hypothetical protein